MWTLVTFFIHIASGDVLATVRTGGFDTRAECVESAEVFTAYDSQNKELAFSTDFRCESSVPPTHYLER